MTPQNDHKLGNGWLGNLIRKISGADPVRLTFVPSVPVDKDAKIMNIGKPIIKDECYIELYLESLRLSKERKFVSTFNGVVYSFVTIIREGEKDAQIAAVSRPSKLVELDNASLGEVIKVSKQMMGPTAFRGNPVSLELGLFSIKSGNLVTPIMDYVTRVSDTAGLSFVGAAKPFLPLITEGMDLLAGQKEETVLEVGYDTDVSLSSGCIFAIINAPKGTYKEGLLKLDMDRELLYNDSPIDCGYAVFSIRSRPDKPDFGKIPDLEERYKQFRSAIRSGNPKNSRDAYNSFRFSVIASPDLIQKDAKLLIDKAKSKLEWAFPVGGAAAVGKGREIGDLSQIGLYD